MDRLKVVTIRGTKMRNRTKTILNRLSMRMKRFTTRSHPPVHLLNYLESENRRVKHLILLR